MVSGFKAVSTNIRGFSFWFTYYDPGRYKAGVNDLERRLITTHGFFEFLKPQDPWYPPKLSFLGKGGRFTSFPTIFLVFLDFCSVLTHFLGG